ASSAARPGHAHRRPRGERSTSRDRLRSHEFPWMASSSRETPAAPSIDTPCLGGGPSHHFESVCYHPLFVFNPEGDCLAAKLRPGNVHSADGWDGMLLPVIDRYRARGQTVVVRAGAAFARPALYEALEQRGGAVRDPPAGQ